MHDSAIYRVITEVRHCALVMLESATYIESELPKVRMNDALRLSTEQVCRAFVGTKHDIVNELDDLEELLDSKAGASMIRSRIDLIIRWLRDDIGKMHQLVKTLQLVSQHDPMCVSAYVLLAESATNIINVFNRARSAANSLRCQEDGT